MEVTFFQKNLSQAEEGAFSSYIQDKLTSIETLMKKFAKDATLLKVSIEKFDKHTAYEVEFCLVLPMKSIVAKEASHQISKAIDLARDRLFNQIKKHMESLRKKRTHRSIRQTLSRSMETMLETAEELI